MKVHSSGLLVFVVAALVACTTDRATKTNAVLVPPVYSHDEALGLLTCLGLSDMAGSIAQQKLDNVPLEKVKSDYASRPDPKVAQMGVATAEKVYAETVSGWWTYESAFFNECAQNLASVPANRVDHANHCMQDSMVVDEAYGFKSQNTPKEEALAYLARFGIQGPIPEAIVDLVYATRKDRPELKTELWNRCMATVSESGDGSGWTAPPAPALVATDPAADPFKGYRSSNARSPE
jgi:hypothetical protein